MRVALGVFVCISLSAQAIPITYEFTGTVSDVYSFGVDDFGIANNDAFSLYVTYDTTAPDQLAQTDLGRYAASGFSLFSNGRQFASASGPFNIWVQDAASTGHSDQLVFTYAFNSITAPWGNSYASLDLVLNDSTRSILPSDALPATLDLSAWDSQSFVFAGGSGGSDFYRFSGNITGIVRVPDFGGTGALMLLLSGLLILARHCGAGRASGRIPQGREKTLS